MKNYKVIADVSKMSYEQWLEMRKNSVGGSEVAAVVGLSRWKTPFEVWGEKTGLTKKQNEQTEAMKWGTLLEPVIRKEFAVRNALEVAEAKCVFAHKDYAYMTANIDGYVKMADGSYAVLEIKTSNYFAAEDWQDGCPIEYYMQVQYYMGILGLNKAFIAVLIGGSDYRQLEVDRDEETIQYIFKKVADFWQMVEKRVPPEVGAGDTTLLNKLFGKSKAEIKILSDDMVGLCAEYEKAKADADEAKKRKEEAEAKLKMAMGTAESASCGDFKISWKSSSRKSFSADKAKELLNIEQIKECTVESASRTFRVSRKTKK